MQLGMIGLGRMGANMAMRLMKAGHECIVYDSHSEPVQALVNQGAKGFDRSNCVREKSVEAPCRVADGAGRGG
jgi:6-phosphogluconate dehydrogenase (decarboxylating)